MLVGAFAAVVGHGLDRACPEMGVLAAVAGRRSWWRSCSALVVVDLRGDAIVAGLAINLFALGATTFLMRVDLRRPGRLLRPDDAGPAARSTIPIVGRHPGARARCCRGQTVLVWVALARSSLLQVLLFHHRIGLRMRAVGEDPVAAGSVGVRVRRVQYLRGPRLRACCAASPGAQLSLGLVTQFVEGMTFGPRLHRARGGHVRARPSARRVRREPVLRRRLRARAAAAGRRIPSQFVSMLPVPRHDPGAGPDPCPTVSPASGWCAPGGAAGGRSGAQLTTEPVLEHGGQRPDEAVESGCGCGGRRGRSGGSLWVRNAQPPKPLRIPSTRRGDASTPPDRASLVKGRPGCPRYPHHDGDEGMRRYEINTYRQPNAAGGAHHGPPGSGRAARRAHAVKLSVMQENLARGLSVVSRAVSSRNRCRCSPTCCCAPRTPGSS